MIWQLADSLSCRMSGARISLQSRRRRRRSIDIRGRAKRAVAILAVIVAGSNTRIMVESVGGLRRIMCREEEPEK